MKTVAICAMLMAVYVSPAWSQPLDTKDATFDYVATSLADIEQVSEAMMAATSQQTVAEMLKHALDKVSSLRDVLRSNPWVEVAGFSVGLPTGVSVEFNFKD